ncbi:MAG: chemotaxis protein CheB [Pseudomonadales bacterium]|jgi:two-component system CheB/CheR fusion protein|nr:chemotaxis protein CheB [Pseudomonadales bacterium]
MDFENSGEAGEEDPVFPDPLAPSFTGTIVALGASAGGLDALDRFFSSLPDLPGTAFVVIQHLAPEHRTMMDTLLARHTSMRVAVAEDGQAVKGGHVYVIPPGVTMSIHGGHLHLTPRPKAGITLPIDVFLESLAADAPDRAIAIILSGTGSDGTRGAETLNAVGGWVLAQDPDSAHFDGMPRSVAAAGVCDRALPPEGLAEAVGRIVRGEAPEGSPALPPLAETDTREAIAELLRPYGGIDLRQYKSATLERRVERRLRALKLATLEAYRDHLTSHPQERDTLRREILIPVTRFFRDPHAFEALRTLAVVPLVEACRDRGDQTLRAWVAACATGEEAYSLAMLFLDAIEEVAPGLELKLFATDAEQSYIDVASLGVYDDDSLSAVPAALREKWFEVAEDGRRRVRLGLRQRIIFSRHDLLSDAPFTQLDLVSCRNVLIYLRPEAQDRVIRRLAFALRTGGVLFLGSSETPTAHANGFDVLEGRAKLYRLRRRVTALPPEDLLIPARRRSRSAESVAEPAVAPVRIAHESAVEALVRAYAPASILIDRDRTLLHLFGDVHRRLGFRPGGASLDVLQLLPERIAPIASALIHAAIRDGAPHRSRPLELEADGPDTPPLALRLAVLPLGETGRTVEHLLICFETESASVEANLTADADLDALGAAQVSDLERELELTRVSLNDTIQELSTANEELQATNEELMAANEELQSTNEELQSVNEELHTINAEYQGKISELNELNADLESLTRAAGIPIVFLDRHLRLIRFTPSSTKLFTFRDADLGRPLADFNHRLIFQDLHPVLEACRETREPVQREVRDQDGRTWLVAIVPHANREVVERVVVSCIDVTASHDAERLQHVLDALPQHVAVLDRTGTIVMVNRAWRAFAEFNGDLELRSTCTGANYLGACRSTADDDGFARRALEGLERVLAGSPTGFSMRYPCHGPEESRWFVMHATGLAEGGCVVSHFRLTEWVDPEWMRRLDAEERT